MNPKQDNTPRGLPAFTIRYSPWSVGTLRCDEKTGELSIHNAWYRRIMARVHLFWHGLRAH